MRQATLLLLIFALFLNLLCKFLYCNHFVQLPHTQASTHTHTHTHTHTPLTHAPTQTSTPQQLLSLSNGSCLKFNKRKASAACKLRPIKALFRYTTCWQYYLYMHTQAHAHMYIYMLKIIVFTSAPGKRFIFEKHSLNFAWGAIKFLAYFCFNFYLKSLWNVC